MSFSPEATATLRRALVEYSQNPSEPIHLLFSSSRIDSSSSKSSRPKSRSIEMTNSNTRVASVSS